MYGRLCADRRQYEHRCFELSKNCPTSSQGGIDEHSKALKLSSKQLGALTLKIGLSVSSHRRCFSSSPIPTLCTGGFPPLVRLLAPCPAVADDDDNDDVFLCVYVYLLIVIEK